MLKSISKIAIVLFITFLSGLVMTDSVLPELKSEERAEIEIEEEEEIEISNLIQSKFTTNCEDGGGDDEISVVQVVLQDNDFKLDTQCQYNVVENKIESLTLSKETPLYILYCALKLNI